MSVKRETVLELDPVTRKAEPFPPGNDLSLRHGVYSRRLLEGDAAHLEEELASVAPDASSPVLALAALTTAQVFRAERALREAPAGADMAELKRDAHRWHARLESLYTRMGLLADKDGRLVSVQVALVQSPEWQTLQRKIAAALAPHPAALDAVLAAIEEPEVIDAE
jgi:hypothetical protein